MLKQRMLVWVVLVVVCVAVGLGGGALWKFVRPTPQVTTNVVRKSPPVVTPTEEPWKGMRLVIPSVGINAPVEPVGVTTGGQLAVPTKNQWEGAGWYQGGPLPGQHGSAVIDGHLDRPGGAPAVFWRLHELRVGDEVQVVMAHGNVLHFRVKKVQDYTPQAAPLTTIFRDTSGTNLNLITCAGQWVPSEHQTTLRHVVYTTLEAP